MAIIKDVKPKQKKEVLIPDRLKEFLTYVNSLILNKDEAATIPSDDLIQNDFASGGLEEENGNSYYFTYSPEEIARDEWKLRLDKETINKISQGTIKKLTLWGCAKNNCHNLFSNPKGTCSRCDYFDDKKPAKDKKLRKIREASNNKAEWLLNYFAIFPNSSPPQIIRDYNSDTALGAKWGSFTINEIVDKMKEIEKIFSTKNHKR